MFHFERRCKRVRNCTAYFKRFISFHRQSCGVQQNRDEELQEAKPLYICLTASILLPKLLHRLVPYWGTRSYGNAYHSALSNINNLRVHSTLLPRASEASIIFQNPMGRPTEYITAGRRYGRTGFDHTYYIEGNLFAPRGRPLALIGESLVLTFVCQEP